MLGEPAPARLVLLDSLFQGIALNLLLTLPVYAVARRLLPPQGAGWREGKERRLLASDGTAPRGPRQPRAFCRPTRASRSRIC